MIWIVFAAMAPILPFLSTILKQRGYSSVVVGAMLTVLPLPGLLIRPVVGGVTDKYKCRKKAIVLNACVMFALVLGLLFAPGTSAAATGPVAELADADVFRSPTFWLFASMTAVLYTTVAIKTVLDDTICINLLGTNDYNVLYPGSGSTCEI